MLPLAAAATLYAPQFQNLKLEPTKFSAWTDLTEALHSGAIQGAVTMLELALVGRDKGVPLKVVTLSHREGDVLIVRPEINSVAELKYEDIKTVEIAPPVMVAALVAKEVDAYIVAEPFGAAAVMRGAGKALLRAQDIWKNWLCCGLVMREDALKESPVAAQEMVDAFVRGADRTDKNRTEAVQIASQFFGHKQDLMETSLQWIHYHDLIPRKEEFDQLHLHMTDLGLIKNKVNWDDLLDASFATKAYAALNK